MNTAPPFSLYSDPLLKSNVFHILDQIIHIFYSFKIHQMLSPSYPTERP